MSHVVKECDPVYLFVNDDTKEFDARDIRTLTLLMHINERRFGSKGHGL